MVTVCLLYGRRDFFTSLWHCVHKGNCIGLSGEEEELVEDGVGDGGDEHDIDGGDEHDIDGGDEQDIAGNW